MHNKILSHLCSGGQFCFVILRYTIINVILNVTPSLGVLSLILSLLYYMLLQQELSISHIDSSMMSALNN